MGKGDRKKAPKKAKAAHTHTHSARARRTAPQPEPLAPTPQQADKGVYARARGPGRTEYVVNLASDMIGRLLAERQITPQQEQTARAFQGLYAAWCEELGLSGFKSCLDIAVAGHDESNGRPEVVAAYTALRDRIGRVKIAVLTVETAKGAHERPNDLGALRNALDVAEGAI